MSRRIWKQFWYGLLFLAFWVAVIGGVYFLFFKAAPTCFDGRQNQDEEGIDCGGSCAKVCLYSGFRPLELAGGVSVFFPDERTFALLAAVKNPNPDVAAPNLAYSFVMTDVNDKTITIPGTSFIYASEIKYLTALQARRPDFDFTRLKVLTVQLADPQWVKKKDFPQAELKVQERNVIQSDGLKVEGRLVNQDTVGFARVEVVAIFFNRLGAPAGVSQTQLTDVRVNDDRSFVILHPTISGVDPNATQIAINAFRL